MSIWKTKMTVEELTTRSQNTMGATLGIEYVEIGDDYIIARMPVNENTKQPMGLLHGGASAALAETVGSICAWMSVDQATQSIVGLDLNINHIRAVKDGWVIAICRPYHKGRTTQVWNIEIKDEAQNLVSVARLTTMTIKRH